MKGCTSFLRVRMNGVDVVFRCDQGRHDGFHEGSSSDGARFRWLKDDKPTPDQVPAWVEDWEVGDIQ